MTMPRRDHENALTGTPQRRLSANHNRANSAPMVSVDRSHPVPLESSPTGRGCDQNTHEQDYRIAEADTITIDANARDDDNYNANTFQDEISDPEGKRTRNWKRILCRAVISITMVSSISFVAIDFFTNQHLKEGLGHFLDWWKQHTVAGTFAFLGLFVIASLVFFPPSLLTLGIGWVYTEVYGLSVGVAVATFVSCLGSALGASVAFCRSRYMMRDMVKRFARRYNVIRAVDTTIKTNGFRIYTLLRLSPLMPFNAINYIAGISGISFSTYMYSLIGILPKTLLTVFIGATAGSVNGKGLDGKDKSAALWSMVGGGILGVLVVIFTSCYAKKELNNIILRQQVEEAILEYDRTVDELSDAGEETDHRVAGNNTGTTNTARDNETVSDQSDSNDEGTEDTAWFWVWT